MARAKSQFVRDLTTKKLHSLAMKLSREFSAPDGISTREEWLLDQCLRELAYRRRHVAAWHRCYCELCFSPFGD